MSNSDYAWVLTAFQFGYMIFYSTGGRLGDRWGVRLARGWSVHKARRTIM